MAGEDAIEQRLANLEREVAELRQRLDRLDPRQNWLDRISGSLKDYPEFEEVIRLGREFREADRPPPEA